MKDQEALEYQEWLALRKELGKDQPAPTLGDQALDVAERYIARPLGRTARAAASSVGELGELFVNPIRGALGLEPVSTKAGIDQLTNNYFAPRNSTEEIVDTAVGFAAPGGVFSKASKLAKPGMVRNALNTLGTNNKAQLTSDALGGAAYEGVNQLDPNNPLAAFGASLLGASLPQAGKSAVNLGKNVVDNLNPSTLKKKEISNINTFLDKVSPEYMGAVNDDIRDAAKSIIKDERSILQNKAKPYYEKASPNKVSPEKLRNLFKENPVIADSLQSVLKEKAYIPEIKKFGKDSIYTLDLVKKELDNKIENLSSNLNADKNKYKASRIAKARDSLVETLDELSPDYKQGRAIYSEDLPAIKSIEQSKIGKISKFKDSQLKNIGRELFDKQETNPKRFEMLRDRIYDKNPEAWKAITRQEIERKMGDAESGIKNLYNKAFKDKKSYDLMREALFYDPKAQKQLEHLKEVFSKTLDTPNALKLFGNRAANIVSGKEIYELITNPKWGDELEKLATNKQLSPADDSLGKVLSKTSVSSAKQSNLSEEELERREWLQLKEELNR